MGKVLYSVTMSLDGFIAGPGGDMAWLSPHLGPNPQIDALQRDIGALLVGNRTFRGDDPNRGTDKSQVSRAPIAIYRAVSRHYSRIRV